MVKRRAKEAPEVDIESEESVESEMAAALDEEAEALFIEHDKNYESFGAGTVWRVEIGSQEYFVMADAVAADELAVEMVKQDLEQEPEIFDQDFISQYIDEKKLAKELRSDVEEREEETAKDMDAAEFWTTASDFGMYIPEEDDNGEQRDPTEEEISELVQLSVDAQLKDPMQYLEDIYGKEDARKQAIEIAGIDIDKAAVEAIKADGAGQYLSSYDGNLDETAGGFAYWRHN